jgi:hypothetical protein
MKQSATAKGAQKQQALDEAEADYRAGILSVNGVSRKHGLPESTLRRDAKRLGWTRASAEFRRQMVRNALAGANLTSEMTKKQVHQIQVEAAEQDERDMRTGLDVSRACLTKLLAMVGEASEVRDIKTILESNQIAVNTIRKVRSLDDAEPEQVASSVTVDLNASFSELREAFRRRLTRIDELTDEQGD